MENLYIYTFCMVSSITGYFLEILLDPNQIRNMHLYTCTWINIFGSMFHLICSALEHFGDLTNSSKIIFCYFAVSIVYSWHLTYILPQNSPSINNHVPNLNSGPETLVFCEPSPIIISSIDSLFSWILGYNLMAS